MSMRPIRLAMALLAMASASTAMSANWRINSYADVVVGVWVAGCEAYVGDTEDDFRLELDEETLALRAQRREDIYRPVLILESDASQGARRARQSAGPDLDTTYYAATDTWFFQEPVNEFRISYSLTGVQGTQRAWVFSDRDRWFDATNILILDSATTYWLDYPAAMFDSNASKSIRITAGGVRRGGRAADNHWQHQRFSYSHGAEMMALMRSCIDAHIERGHVDLPDGSASVREIKRRRAERELKARHSR